MKSPLSTHFHSLSILMAFLMIPGLTFGQKQMSSEQKTQLLTIAGELQQQEVQDRQEAVEMAREKGWPIRFQNDEGVTFELRAITNGQPEYLMTYNRQAAISTGTNHVQTGGRADFHLNGEGMIVGEWDGGGTLTSHVEFEGRAIQRDQAGGVSNHATHVGGTMIAAGINPEAKGMAPKATLWTHDWGNDGSEMAQEAAEGLLISNHSYGTIAGWARGDWSDQGFDMWHWWGDPSIDAEEDYKFGYYNQRAAQWDNIALNAPFYLIVKSAGNNRNDNHNGTHMVRIDGDWVESDAFRQRSGGPDGFDCLPTYSTAKNILTVGAVNSVSGGYSGPSSVNMTSFSSWGPTDDGRIKPDIVGDGVQLLSANSSSPTAYGRSSGTSMSSPNVSGSLLLLQQLHRDITGDFMRSSSLKGLAIHTADEAGNSGPDYTYGWGLLNTEKAAEVVAQPLQHPFFEESLSQDDTIQYEIISDGNNPIKATLCWTDPAASPLPPALNDRTPRLVNDLDLRIIALSGPDSGEVYDPYFLDPDNPGEPAFVGDNSVDNVEMVDPGVLPAGDYLVQVTHKGSLKDGSAQDYSLWISAPPADCSFALEVDSVIAPLCPESKAGAAYLTTEGGSGDIEYFFSGNSNGMDSIITGLAAGKHYFSAIDSQGCFASTSISFERPESLEFGDFEQVVARINSPVEERRAYSFSTSASSGWGGDPSNLWLRENGVLVDDGSQQSDLGCGDLINSSELEGNIAIVRRGDCEFGTKALNAQNAGASGIIIVNSDEGVIQMGGGSDGPQVNIPVFMIGNSEGNALISLMEDEEVVLSLGFAQEIEHPTCATTSNGNINVLTLPGNQPVAFEWSTGDTTESLSEVPAGQYSLTITDQNQCEYTREYELTAPDSIETTFERVDPVSCPGGEDGSAAVAVIGGVPPYKFAWSSGESSATANELNEGLNSVTITDANGCILIDSVSVNTAPTVSIDSFLFVPACPGGENGIVEVRVQNGVAPYQLVWNDGDSTELSRDSLSGGMYHFSLEDGCGTTIEDSVAVPVATDSLSLEAAVQQPNCFGETGVIEIRPNGGRPPYHAVWADSVEELTRSVEGGIYTAELFDACNTSALVDSIEILVPDSLELGLDSKTEISCPGAADGALEVHVAGGTGELNLLWSTGDTTETIEELAGGDYTLTVSDENGCQKVQTFLLESPEPLKLAFEYELEEPTIQMINQTSAAHSYRWTFGDGNTSEEESPEHTYEEDGTYEICLEAWNDCDTMTQCEEVTVEGVSAPTTVRATDIRIYPNPAQDRVRIELPQSEGELILRNSLGLPVHQRKALRTQEIQLNSWTSGLYWVEWKGAMQQLVIID